MSLIEARQICKSISDEFGLKDISFEILNKGVYGFLGKSGSGKSLLALILAGACEPDSGTLVYNERELYSSQKQTVQIKKKIGFVSQKCFFDKDMTAFEVLDFIGKSKGVDADKRYRQIKEALELTGLSAKKDFLVCKLSLSEKKRLEIAGALLANPEVIVMDEPLRYLDPTQADEVKKLIAMLGKKKIVLIFTQYASEIEELCEYTAILASGKLVLWESVEKIIAKLNENGMSGLSVALDAFDVKEG